MLPRIGFLLLRQHTTQQSFSQVGKLQQDRDPFPFRPVIPYDDDDDEDDRGLYAEPA